MVCVVYLLYVGGVIVRYFYLHSSVVKSSNKQAITYAIFVIRPMMTFLAGLIIGDAVPTEKPEHATTC